MKEEDLSRQGVTVAPTNARIAPSTRSKVISVLPKGAKVEKIGESGNWTKVRLPSGEEAWIFSDFLQQGPPGESERVSPPPMGTPPPQPPTPPKAKTGGPPKKSAEAAKPSLFATKDITRMRAEPDPKSKVVLVLKKGRQVEKLADSGSFTKVKLSWGDTGWVLTRSLQPLP